MEGLALDSAAERNDMVRLLGASFQLISALFALIALLLEKLGLLGWAQILALLLEERKQTFLGAHGHRFVSVRNLCICQRGEAVAKIFEILLVLWDALNHTKLSTGCWDS